MDKNLAKKPLTFKYMLAMTAAFAAGVGAFILVIMLLGEGGGAQALAFIAFLLVCGYFTLLGERRFGPRWNPETREWEKR